MQVVSKTQEKYQSAKDALENIVEEYNRALHRAHTQMEVGTYEIVERIEELQKGARLDLA